MPRASWRGFLRLSLVSCPVGASRDGNGRFHLDEPLGAELRPIIRAFLCRRGDPARDRVPSPPGWGELPPAPFPAGRAEGPGNGAGLGDPAGEGGPRVAGGRSGQRPGRSGRALVVRARDNVSAGRSPQSRPGSGVHSRSSLQ